MAFTNLALPQRYALLVAQLERAQEQFFLGQPWAGAKVFTDFQQDLDVYLRLSVLAPVAENSWPKGDPQRILSLVTQVNQVIERNEDPMPLLDDLYTFLDAYETASHLFSMELGQELTRGAA